MMTTTFATTASARWYGGFSVRLVAQSRGRRRTANGGFRKLDKNGPGNDDAGDEKGQHRHEEREVDPLGDQCARLRPFENSSIPTAVEQVVANQQRKHGGAEDFVD
ncbi:hypothetical protein [Devosia sp.]|uniref:hypothetical protein n=1 Tax=Devosia sp. TaxID=1871048 RepID=UPI00261F56DB|nr:hypothetical protein [Devosia sp.]